MKNHLKTLSSPKTWLINRKDKKYIVRPKPGPQSLDASLPLGLILRDLLKKTRTMREAKKLLNNKQVLIDGKRRKEYRLPVGLFDVVSFPEIKEDYRILFDTKGRVTFKKIDPKENKVKPCKIVGKTMLAKKLQLNLHDGKNILVEKDFKCKVGDTVIINLPDHKVKELLELKKDAFIYLIKGKRGGDSGLFQEAKGNLIIYQKGKEKIQTLKKYLFVLGDKKSVIDIKIE